MSTAAAYITKIKVSPHPNADNLALGNVAGIQLVVNKATEDNQLGVFFSSELKVSPQYADANNLRRQDGGFFEDNLRVRAINLRSEKSEGYFAPLDSLAFTGADITKFKVGDTFTELNGIPICEKYVTPATQRQINRTQSRKTIAAFPKHYDTDQLAYKGMTIPYGSILWITDKYHGTSGRTGYVIDENKVDDRPWYKRVFGKKFTPKFELVSGTRNTVLKQYSDGESSKAFRAQINDAFEGLLHENEIVYYEIVGWEDHQKTIMGKHNFSGSREYKHWGDGVTYSYGQLEGTYGVYIYRITQMMKNQMGHWVTRDLTWPQVKSRSKELGFAHVPELTQTPIMSNWTADDPEAPEFPKFMEYMNQLCDAAHPDTHAHPNEGVVVHVLTPQGAIYALKHKSMIFKVAEGIAKESDDYIDAEEIS